MKAVKWLRWRNARTNGTHVHAFLVDAEGHIHKSVCRKRPRAGSIEIILSPGEVFEDMCGLCDRELRSKGRLARPARPPRATNYTPRFRFEDWSES